MADTPPPTDDPPGPGYWKASDGNWYPPDSVPGQAAPTPPPVQWAPPGAGPILPPRTQLSSLGKRFGNALLAVLLIIVTLVIGYVIWAFVVYGRGQTPAKQLLGMYVIDAQTGLPATWGTMFLRGWVIDGVLGWFTGGIFGVVSAVWIFTGDHNQRLTDKMVNTVVVDAPQGLATR